MVPVARMLAGALAAVTLAGPAASNGQAPATPRTIGLVLTGLWYAMHETPGGKTECPAGFNAETLQQFRAQFPTAEAQNAQFLHAADFQSRAPGGMNTTNNPDLAGPEPLPARYVEGAVGTGLDLDRGATGKTCAHGEFTSPDGETGIDNQMYRVMGCVSGWRSSGFHAGIVQQNIRERVANRTLLEISGVDDAKNDDHVEIAIYKGRDALVEDATGKVTSFQTQRRDPRLAWAVQRTTGRIIEGVLITEPVEMELPFFMVSARGSIQLHAMRLRLKLGEAGATGLMGGYSDIARWYNFFTRAAATSDFLGGISAPTVYQGLRRFADGDRDPATGQCTSISTAYDVKFTRVFIADASKGSPQ